MRVITSVALATILSISTLIGSTTRAAQDKSKDQKVVQSSEQIKITKTEVTLPVIVTDKNGRFVHDLTKKNFEIYEDKKRQEIADFQAANDLPLYITVLLDTSASVKREKLELAKEATLNFLKTVLRQRKDQALLVTFDSTVE